MSGTAGHHRPVHHQSCPGSVPTKVSSWPVKFTFEGPAEGKGPILIFPLSDGGQLALRPAGHWINQGRLGPPESVKTGRTRSWRIWSRKRRLYGSERKRRLLHNFSVQKMRSECTIFPYGIEVAFLGKSSEKCTQFRPAHSYLWTGNEQKRSKVTKRPLLTVPPQSDEWGRLKGDGKTRKNTRKHGKHRESVFHTPH